MARPVGAKNKVKKEPALVDTLEHGVGPYDSVVPFTGVARSVECHKQQGHNNFRIATLTIENGLVVKKHLSDPYASFEAIARLEVQCHEATLGLNHGYTDGKAWKK